MSSSEEEAEFQEDSDDDDIPLSELAKRGKARKKETDDEDDFIVDDDEEEEEEEESYDDDFDDDDDYAEEEETSNKKKKARGSDDDDDDDVPLAALKPPKKPKTNAAKQNGKKSTGSSKKKASQNGSKASKKKKPVLKKKESFSGETDTISGAMYASSVDCTKGKMIQRLLCRWWYAIKWPDPESLPAKPPENYDALDGFPGAYVCTAGENVGHILDMRDKESAPTFNNFLKKSSQELQNLLIQALEAQKKELIEAEGSGTPTEKELNSMLSWAKKVTPSKAEREATNVLKAAGYTPP